MIIPRNNINTFSFVIETHCVPFDIGIDLLHFCGICASKVQVYIVNSFPKLPHLKVYKKGTHHTSIVNLNQLMMFRAIMAVYSENELKNPQILSLGEVFSS